MGDTGDPDRPGGSGGDGDSKSLTIAGDYVVKSEFKVSKLETGGNLELDLQELADDPVREIADMIADDLNVSFLRSTIEKFLDEAMGTRKARLSSAITDFVEATRNFELVSNMTIKGEGSSMQMTHYPSGMEVEIKGEKYEYAFDDLKADTLTEYPMTVSGTTLKFKEHHMEIPYTQMLVTVMDQVIVPAIDPDSADLGDALNQIVDCGTVGTKLEGSEIDQTLSFLNFDAGDYAGFCEDAVDAVALSIINEIGKTNSVSVAVALDGKATVADANNDGKADSISGSWNSVFQGDLENKVASPFKAQRD